LAPNCRLRAIAALAVAGELLGNHGAWLAERPGDVFASRLGATAKEPSHLHLQSRHLRIALALRHRAVLSCANLRILISEFDAISKSVAKLET